MPASGGSDLVQTMDRLDVITPGVTTSLQDFCNLALENIKVYRPEISRLDAKTDAINQELHHLNTDVHKALNVREEEHRLVCQRCSFLEERMSKLEALVAVLPTWKEDLMSKMDTLAREGRVRHEQVSMRTQMLEDQVSQNAQAARERLDHLTQLGRTLTEARAAHGERMDGLEKQIRQVDAAHGYSIKSLEDAKDAHARELQTHDRKLTEQSALLSMSRIDIDALRQKAIEAERDIDSNTSNILAIQDKQDLFNNNIMLMDKQLKSNDVLRDSLAERVGTLERDTRVQALQATASDYVAFKQQVSNFMHEQLEGDKGLEARLASMDARIDKGPPGLWKITEQVAAQAEQLATHRDELTVAASRLAVLDESLAAARRAIEDQKQSAVDIQSDSRAMADRIDNEAKRVLSYVDSRLENLVAKYEVEAVRKLIEAVRRELHEAIGNMGHRVKFELLHDEVPQVNTLKAYIQQTEQAMARTMDRLGWLEAGLGKENERVEGLASEWVTTKAALDTMILDGTFDVARMKRELQGFKDMFEELGRMASRGQIITVTQAEALVDRAVRGPTVEAMIARKLADSKILKQELEGYVPRHELEGLRQVIAANGALALMASNAAANPSHQAAHQHQHQHHQDHPPSRPESPVRSPSRAASAATRSKSARHLSLAIPGSPSSTQNGAASPATTTGATQPAMPPPAARLNVEDSALLAVYQRLATVEEALAGCNAQAAGLHSKVDEATRKVTATSLQVEAEVPALKDQLSELRNSLAKVKSGHTDSAYAEAAVRRLVNKSVLPEVIERQASDTQRIVRFVTKQLSRTADAGQLKELQATVDLLRQQLTGHLEAQKQSSDDAPRAGAADDGATREETLAQAPAEQDAQAGGGGEPANLISLGLAPDLTIDQVVASGGVEEAAARKAEQEAQEAQQRAAQEQQDNVPLEQLLAPSLEQQAVTLRALAVRMEAAERALADMAASHTHSTPTPSQEDGGRSIKSGAGSVSFAQGTKPGAPAPPPSGEDGLHADFAGQLSDLQVAVHELTGQLPLMARAYEVEGLRRQLVDTRTQLEMQIGRASIGPSGRAPALNITLACHTPDGHHPPPAAQAAAAAAPEEGPQADAAAAQPGVAAEAERMADCYALLQQHSAWQKVVAGQLAEQVASLQGVVATCDERSVAVEKRWLASSARWQQGVALLQEALPRMERLAATTKARVQHILAHTSQFVVQSKLDELLGECGNVTQLKQQLKDLQGVVTALRAAVDAGVGTASSPSRQRSNRNRGAMPHRSALPMTDLTALALPLPPLLPSFTAQDGDITPSVTTSVTTSVATSPRGQATQAIPELPTLHEGNEGEDGAAPAQAPSAPTAPPAAQATSAPQPPAPAPGAPADAPSNPNAAVPGAGQQGDAATDALLAAAAKQVALVGSQAPPPPHPGAPGWGPDGTPRHLHGAEHADTELAGIMHDLMHATHRSLLASKDGPLPGNVALELGQGNSVREAALKRLRSKPYEVQQHVELLEAAKRQFDRLVSSTAVSTTDYMALYLLMLDVRVKLLEDTAEVHKEHMSTAYRNLESAFNYLKKLQEAVNSKGGLAALSAVDKVLRSLGKEMVQLGHPPMGGGQAGLLHGTSIGTHEFWAPFLTSGGPEAPAAGRVASPPRSPGPRSARRGAGDRTPANADRQARPLTPSTPPTTVIPSIMGTAYSVSGAPYPPPSFHSPKRDLVAEQHRVMATLRAAEQTMAGAQLPTIQYVAAGGTGPHSPSTAAGALTGERPGSGGGAGLPVLARRRPSTARAADGRAS